MNVQVTLNLMEAALLARFADNKLAIELPHADIPDTYQELIRARDRLIDIGLIDGPHATAAGLRALGREPLKPLTAVDHLRAFIDDDCDNEEPDGKHACRYCGGGYTVILTCPPKGLFSHKGGCIYSVVADHLRSEADEEQS